MDQDEITARVYQVIKRWQGLSNSAVLDKLKQELPDVPMKRILISINHLSEG